MLKVRLATKSDKNEILLINPLLSKTIITYRLSQQEKKEAEYLVIDDGIHLLGQVFLKWYGKQTHPEYPDIENIYIKGSERGKGYGALLVKECEKRTKDKGYSKIGLAVNHEVNCPEQKLYRKLGYRHDGKSTYTLELYPGIKERVIDMEKSL
jgi:GNAT superfamily N-acetyltransferase